jgi:hypothetical protein
VFSFGIGSSVNRSLLDKIALEGKGEVEYVGLNDDGSKAAKKFYERVRTPLLTDLSIDWNGMPVADVFPTKLTDLFSAKPVIVHGRYTKPASGTIKLRGKVAGQPYEREIKIDLPDSQAANDPLATLWARTRIAELSSDKLRDANPKKTAEYDRQIASLGLEFRLLTNFTSFVAVEDRIVNQNGKPVTVQVPVELPEGTTLSAAYKKWVKNDVAYIVTGEERRTFGGGGGRSVANLPVNARSSSQLVTLSSGVVNASVAETVTVTADAGTIDTTSSSVTTVIRPDEAGRQISSKSKSPGRTKRSSGSGTGSGRGNGVGYGSGRGIGSGNASGDVPPPPQPGPAVTVTPEQIRETRLKEKLHSWLYPVVDRLARGDSKPTANEALFVRNGRAEIQIELTTKSLEVLEKLKAAGFELVSEKGKTGVVGRIAVEKLASLTEIAEVKLILPKT